jgi:antitoxin ParD1/3/4
MTTMNISLPDALKAFVDSRTEEGGYGTSSEYVRELIRRDQARLGLRRLILEGLESKPLNAVDDTYWNRKRKRLSARA